MSLRTKKDARSGKASVAFVGDDNTGLHSAAADHVALLAGGVAVLEYGTNASSKVKRIEQCERVALAAADTAGGVFAWANPTGGSIIVTRVAVNVTTASSGACTVDVGVAADATTLNDTIIDGVSVAATGCKDSQKDAGSNGAGMAQVTSTQYVTGSVASGASSGLVGFAYIYYHAV